MLSLKPFRRYLKSINNLTAAPTPACHGCWSAGTQPSVFVAAAMAFLKLSAEYFNMESMYYGF